MEWEPLAKPRGSLRREPCLADYDKARREFTWQQAGALLEGLPGGALNIAQIDNSSILNETIRKGFSLIIDVWEDEPLVNINLLGKTKVATAHIAGYSFEGKVNGTKMIYDALCRFTNTKPEWTHELPSIEWLDLKLPEVKSDEEKLYKLYSSIYNIEQDDAGLRAISNYKLNEQAGYFDMLRKTYPVRRDSATLPFTYQKKKNVLKQFLKVSASK